MRKHYIIEVVTQIVGDKPTAELVVERLQEEGLLVLGYGDKDVDNIVTTFAEVFGTTKISKTDRFAANRLAKTHGAQAVTGVIRLLGEHSNDKYAPVVGSVTQLEDKFVGVLHFLRSLDKGETIQT